MTSQEEGQSKKVSAGSKPDDIDSYFKRREQASKAKAEQLAELAGVKLGEPTYISESTSYYMPTSNYISRDMVAEAASPAISTDISAGQLEISANVQVSFSID